MYQRGMCTLALPTPSTGITNILYPVLSWIRTYKEAKSINRKKVEKGVGFALSLYSYGLIEKTYPRIM